MSDRGVTLSEAFAKRVDTAVKRVEASPVVAPTGTRRRNDPALFRWFLRGKLNTDLLAGQSAVMTIWYWNGTAETASSETVTVYDWMLTSGQKISGGKKVVASFDYASGRYYVTASECP